MSADPYTQCDLESDLNDLRCLLEQGSWMLNERPHEGSREQEIAEALVRVAHHLAVECCRRIAAMPARSMGDAL